MWVFIVLLMALTAWANMVEMATFSARPERLNQLIAEGNSKAKLVILYQRLPLPFLSSIQVMTTSASLIIGYLIGRDLIAPTQLWMSNLALIKPFAAWLAPLTVLLLSTVLSLTLTNVIPKEIGFKWADSVAVRWAGVMNILIRISKPLAWIVQRVCMLIEAVIVKNPDVKTRVTEADIHTLLNEGVSRGSLNRHEAAIVRNALQLSEQSILELAIPRVDIVWVDLGMDPKSIEALLKKTPHSYVLACEGGLDEVRGVLRSRDWFAAKDHSLESLKKLLIPLPKVRESKTALDILAAFGSADVRAVVIADEEDKVKGLVTMPMILKHLASVAKR
jgi:putative hemolysin